MSVARRLVAALGLHMALKVFSFSVGVLLTRSQTAEMRGASFAIDLYVNSALFLSVAAVRAVNARRGFRTVLDVTEAFAFGWMALVVFVAIALPICVTHLIFTQPEALVASVLSPRAAIGLLAGVGFELLAEPVYGIALALGQFQRKVLCEGLAVFLRLAVVTAVIRSTSIHPFLVSDRGGGGAVGVSDVDVAVAAHALGLVANGLFVWIFYTLTLRRTLMINSSSATRNNTTTATTGNGGDSSSSSSHDHHYGGHAAAAVAEAAQGALRQGSLSYLQHPRQLVRSVVKACRRSMSLFRELFSESLLRMVLTEGEKAVLTAKGNLSSQGVYDVISGLGALVVRVVFRLWEDFTFAAWSAPDENSGDPDRALERMSSASSPRTKSSGAFDARLVVGRVSDAKWSLLFGMIRLSIHFGALAVAFGPPLSRRVLWTLFGGSRTSDWVSEEAEAVLVAYIYYLPLLGVNGLLEAFVRATAPEGALRRVKTAMLACSLGYIALCVVTLFYLDAGAAGLVVVNCLNLAVRVGVSVVIIESDIAPASGRQSRAILSGESDGSGGLGGGEPRRPWWLLACLPNAQSSLCHLVAFAAARAVPALLAVGGFASHRRAPSDVGGVAELNPMALDLGTAAGGLVAFALVTALDDATRPMLKKLLAARASVK